MFMNFNLLSAPSSNHKTFPREAVMLVFPIKEGEHRCIMLKQPSKVFDGKNKHQLKTLWSMVLLGPTFYC
jgi:hypothetical protein